MAEKFDYIVIGGGSGGIASARRAALYGAKVALVERSRLGGTCVNVGCVPKKVMFNAANIAHALHDAPAYGFQVAHWQHDWAALKAAREAYIQRLNGMYRSYLEKDAITLLEGSARFIDNRTIEVANRKLTAPHILIAVGARPLFPQIPGAQVGLTSDDFFALEKLPKKSIIAGAGYIAVELASILQALGSETTLLLRHENVLRHFDETISTAVTEALEQQGIRIERHTSVKALSVSPGGGFTAQLHNGTNFACDAFFWAIGRKPDFSGLQLENINLYPDIEGHLKVDAFQNTDIPGIYAVGDVTGKAELTPVAIAAGRALSDRLFGGKPEARISYENIPTVIFSHPPAGTVGLSEHEAAKKYGQENIRVYKTRFINMYYAPLDKKKPTNIKMITLLPEERIVGLHLVGEGVDEMLQGFAVAINMGATRHDFNSTIAIHPTAAEEVVLLK